MILEQWKRFLYCDKNNCQFICHYGSTIETKGWYWNTAVSTMLQDSKGRSDGVKSAVAGWQLKDLTLPMWWRIKRKERFGASPREWWAERTDVVFESPRSRILLTQNFGAKNLDLHHRASGYLHINPRGYIHDTRVTPDGEWQAISTWTPSQANGNDRVAAGFK